MVPIEGGAFHMTEDTSRQPANDLNTNSTDEEQTTGSETTFPSLFATASFQAAGDDGRATGFEKVEKRTLGETALAQEKTAVAEPVNQSWWARFLNGWFSRRSQDEAEVEALPVEESGPQEVPQAVSHYTLEDARNLDRKGSALVRRDSAGALGEEMILSRKDIERIVQAELARERQESGRASLLFLREMSDDLSKARAGLLRAELDVLDEEEQRTLQDSDLPLGERLELIDSIRERRAKVEQQIAEMEKVLAQRAVEMDVLLAELEGPDAIADLRKELARQKLWLAGIETRLAARSKVGPRRLRRWPLLLTLLLFVAVGLGAAALLLSRQTGPDPTLLVEMATLHQAAGNTEEAVRVLDEAVAAGISDAATLERAGQTYFALEAYQKAIEVLTHAVAKAPQKEELRLALARSYGKAGQRQQAIEQYSRLIETTPDNWLYYLEQGQEYEALQDYDQALAHYQKVVEVAPDRVEGHSSQGHLYRKLERYDEAIEQYGRALEVDPSHYWSRLLSGICYAGKRDYAHAIEQYEAAIAVDPERENAYYFLGEAYLAQGHFENALEPYRRAVELRPDWADARLGLGKVYLNLDDCEKAEAEFREALRLQPNHGDAQEGLNACEGE